MFGCWAVGIGNRAFHFQMEQRYGEGWLGQGKEEDFVFSPVWVIREIRYCWVRKGGKSFTVSGCMYSLPEEDVHYSPEESHNLADEKRVPSTGAIFLEPGV